MKSGASGANRTRDNLLRRQMLYPTELRTLPKVRLAMRTLHGKRVEVTSRVGSQKFPPELLINATESVA